MGVVKDIALIVLILLVMGLLPFAMAYLEQALEESHEPGSSRDRS